MHTIIVGAGLAGLAAANILQQNGHTFQIIEQANQVGGRVQSSHIDGHIIDHGFQVYLPAYEYGKLFFNYPSLDFQRFDPGSIVLYDKGFHEIVSDPLRKPFTIFSTLLSKVGSFSDKQRLLKLKGAARRFSKNTNVELPKQSTYDYLVDFGFGQEMIHNFFIPFFSGVFFDQKLETSARMFLYLYDKFATSLASVPKGGMGELSKQLASVLPSDNIHLGHEVISINQKSVQVSSTKNFVGDNIILTTMSDELVHKLAPGKAKLFQSSHTIYFEADEAPHAQKLVGIVAKKNSIVNNVSVMSNVNPDYAPAGKHQLAVSIFSKQFNSEIEAQIKHECKAWFGKQVEEWKVITSFHIEKALPNQKTVKFDANRQDVQVGDNIYLAGDGVLNGSINGALQSGKIAAELAMAREVRS